MKFFSLSIVAALSFTIEAANQTSHNLTVNHLTQANVHSQLERPISNEYIVELHRSTAERQVDNIVQTMLVNARLIDSNQNSSVDTYSVKLNAQQLVELQQFSQVKSIEPNRLIMRPKIKAHIERVSMNQRNASIAWGVDRLDQVNLPLDSTYAPNGLGSGVHAYIIDSGIRTSHDSFAGRAVWDFTASDITEGNDDLNGHGTHMAGTVGGANYGVATDVQLHAVKVLDKDGQGTLAGIIEGINYVTNHHQSPAVAVLGVSVGYSEALNNAVAAAINAGVSFVVANGDDNRDACHYSPGSLNQAMSVSATDINDGASLSSNYGGCVDIYAPGLYVKSDWHTTDLANNTISHSPMAAAHVAGVAAIVRGNDPICSVEQVKTKVLAQGRPNVLSQVKAGTVNLLAGVNTNAETPSCSQGAGFSNVADFANNQFSHISFEPADERSAADIQAKYPNLARFTISGGKAAIRETLDHSRNFGGEGTEGGAVSGTYRVDMGYYGTTTVALTFVTPVDAVGAFIGGGGSATYSYLTVQLENGQTKTVNLNSIGLATVAGGSTECNAINGFVGYDSQGNAKIVSAQFKISRDASSLDDIFFGNANGGLNGQGPTQFAEHNPHLNSSCSLATPQLPVSLP